MKQSLQPIPTRQQQLQQQQNQKASQQVPPQRPRLEPAPDAKPSQVRTSFSNSLVDLSRPPNAMAMGDGVPVMKSPSAADLDEIPPAADMRKLTMGSGGGSSSSSSSSSNVRAQEAPRAQPGGPPAVTRQIQPPNRPAIVPRPPQTIGSKGNSPVSSSFT